MGVRESSLFENDARTWRGEMSTTRAEQALAEVTMTSSIATIRAMIGVRTRGSWLKVCDVSINSVVFWSRARVSSSRRNVNMSLKPSHGGLSMSSKVYRKTSERASSVRYRIRSRSLCQACGKHRGSERSSTEEYALLCAHCSQQLFCSSASSFPNRKGDGFHG